MADQWTKDKPTEPGKYEIRDKVLGLKPLEVEVRIFKHTGSLDMLIHSTGNAVTVADVASWIEWRLIDG